MRHFQRLTAFSQVHPSAFSRIETTVGSTARKKLVIFANHDAFSEIELSTLDVFLAEK